MLIIGTVEYDEVRNILLDTGMCYDVIGIVFKYYGIRYYSKPKNIYELKGFVTNYPTYVQTYDWLVDTPLSRLYYYHTR